MNNFYSRFYLIYKAAGWLFGCHPYHNYSLVAAVGAARPKQVFYGSNFWAENEGTIVSNTSYLIFAKVLDK